MSMFKNLVKEDLGQSEDRLGGGFEALPTGVYAAVVKVAYAMQSAKGAAAVAFVFDVNGKEVRETVYYTKQTGEHYYFDKEDKTKKLPLPGFTLIDDICLMTTGEGLSEQATEPKMVRVYDPAERKEVPTEMPVLVGLIGKTVKLGIMREISPQEKKIEGSNEYAPQYDDNGKLKTRSQNSIKKAFHAESGLTVNEALQGMEQGEFMGAWAERFTGKDDDSKVRAITGAAGAGGRGQTGSGRPSPANAAGEPSTPKKRLFGG